MQTTTPSTLIDLSISCRKLKDLDIFSKSDPQVILYQKRRVPNTRQFEWQEIGRTEIIWNNLNPKFTRSFRISYHFEELQELKFIVVDIDKPNSRDLRDQDLIGVTVANLSEIVGAPGQVLSKVLVLDEKKPVNSQKSRGWISIRAEEVAGTQDLVHFELEARKLDKKDLFGLSDPFLVISRGNIEDTGFTPVYKSDVHKKTLNVKWKPFTMLINKLCNGDYGRALRFEVWDWNRSGKHNFIGQFHTNLKTLLSFQRGHNVMLVNPAKKERKEKKGKTYKGSGWLYFNLARVEKVSSFLDYVRGGYELNLTVAIDFTYSNKPPQQLDSLHFMQQGMLNGYQAAIQRTGRILLDYDKDKAVAVYGFGAKIFQNGAWNVSHCFPCNFNWKNPEVMGLEGIMQAYTYALQNIQFYGPTNFADIIRQATAKARQDAQRAYQILLILTDGEISDMQMTIDAIVDASYNVPLSIVIVGIGNADFSRMDVLDADDTPLAASNGRRMHRDIVQFVPFNKYAHDPSQLAAEVLREIPSQFLSYMRMNKIPAPVVQRVDSFANVEPPQNGYGQAPPPQQQPSNYAQQGSIQYGGISQGSMQQGGVQQGGMQGPQYGQQLPPQPQYGVQQSTFDPQGGQFQQQPNFTPQMYPPMPNRYSPNQPPMVPQQQPAPPPYSYGNAPSQQQQYETPQSSSSSQSQSTMGPSAPNPYEVPRYRI